MKICEEIMNIVAQTSLKKMILEFNHGKKSMEVLFNIYANTQFLLEELDMCHCNSEKPSTTNINKDTACDYSLFTNCSFVHLVRQKTNTTSTEENFVRKTFEKT